MNVSHAAPAAAASTGGAAKAGATGNPLADFMALLSQLGISIEGGEATTQAGLEGQAVNALLVPPPAAGEKKLRDGIQDIAAKLLAKLGKTSKDAAADQGPEKPVGESDAKTDPVAALSALLTHIDPAGAKGLEKIDVASLLTAARAIADGPLKSGDTDAAPVVQSAAGAAPTIAALLARAKDPASLPGIAPGKVQSAFVRLEALVKSDASEAKPVIEKGSKQPPKDSAAPDGPASDEPAQGAAKLAELLTRFTTSAKPGAALGSPPVQAGVSPAKPQIDPQLAAIAQAIQRPLKEENATGDPTGATQAPAAAGLAVGAASTPAADTSGMVDNPATDIADGAIKHHLDLARDSQWLDTLAKDIARAAQSDTQLRFQLNPEHLGSLKVELLNGANGTSVKFTAETEAARAILTDAQPRLVAEARAQGLRISEAQVDLSGHGGGQRHMAEAPVVIRTANAAVAAEVEQGVPAASGERYA